MSRYIDADALIDSMNGEFTDHIEEFRAITIVNDAPTIRTKQIKYYDESENVWKIGRVIVDETD